jgi:dTDP-glucose pyrophosphorylase
MINQNSFQERIIQSDFNILNSLKKMDEVNKKLLLVFDEDTFIGVLSIGDVQRAIIANVPLDTCITKIMRKEYVFANIADDKDKVLKLMQEHRIECMPILGDNQQLVTVYLWDDVFVSAKRSDGIKLGLPVIIMAGGQGARLKPLTNILPKALIPIGEKTIIEQIMDNFCEVGCNTFYISINYRAEMIKHYFSTLKSDSYKITFLQENIPLGTAGSLHLLRGKVNSTFFLSNCDILIDQDILDILEYHRSTKNEITIVAALKHYPIPYGILQTSCEGLLESITEKPEIILKINSGLYILEPNVLNEIPENEFYHITTLIEKLKKENRRVGVFPVSEKSWKDIGEWGEYKKTFR